MILLNALQAIGAFLANFILGLGALLGFVALQPLTPLSETAAQEIAAVVTPPPSATTTTRNSATTEQQVAAATTSPAKTAAKPPTKIPIQASSISTTTSLPPSPSIDPNTLNSETRAAVVNILCSTATGGLYEPISGSGTIIDSRGVILTNAHVGQFFLLQDDPALGDMQCVVRTGSPARAAYTAELIYLPPEWIAANATQITAQQAMGTGENDYAFLRITGTTNPNGSLPSSFPYLSMSTQPPQPKEQMLLAAYPAGFLKGINIESNLYLTSAYANVAQIYIFHDGDPGVGLFSVPGSVVSQGGSSGGAAVRASNGTLAGIISTDTNADTTSQRDLRAITVEHIDQSLQKSGMGGVSSLLSSDLATIAYNFTKNIAPTEKEALVKALLSKNQ